jgi:hypothetical protein
MNEVWAPALLADSGPATPSMAPLPKPGRVLGELLLHVIPDPMVIPPLNRVHENAVDEDAEMKMVTPG